MKSILYLPIALFISHIFAFNTTADFQDDPPVFKVVLDAGHGGHDPGNLGNGYMEKNIALGIVLQAGAELEKHPGIEVIYTRDDDSFVDLFVRGEIANKANADLFVSVHCDSHTSNAYGAHTFVLGLHANEQNFEIAKKENSVIYLEDNYESRYAEYDINSPESVIGLTIMQEEFLDQSIELAKMVQENFAKKLQRRDRKVKQAGFIVLHQTFMPSILIETGFLTNKDEGRYLNSTKGQMQMGKAIADAIVNYKENVRADASISQLPPTTDLPKAPEPRINQVEKSKTPEETTVSVKKDKDAGVIAEKETVLDAKTQEELKIEQPVVTTEKPVEKATENISKVEYTAPEKKEDVAAKKEEISKPEIPVKNSSIIFKVQIMASVKDLPLESKNFNGLNRISKEPYKNMIRYMYGSTDSYEQAKLLKKGADASGYGSSYIVAYENGVRIPVKQALAKL